MCKKAAICATTLFMTGAAVGAEDGGFIDDPAIRFGISVGRSTIEADAIDLEGDSTAWSVFGGYEFNRYFALEGGYIDGGQADDTIANAYVTADSKAWQASAVGSWPMGSIFSVYGRAGALSWETAERARIDNAEIRLKVDGTDPYFGVGAAALVEGALLRLEYSHANLEESDLSMLSLQLVWRF